MDGITAHAMAIELNQCLAGAQVERVSMSRRTDLHLTVFTSERSRLNLTFKADRARPSLLLSDRPVPGGLNPPPAFVMLLRKHLRRARILSVTTPPWERVFHIEFEAIDDLGDPMNRTLVFECMPRTANIILLNKDRVILGALRHIDHRVNRVREILPAHPYLPPPPQNRPDPIACTALPTDQLLGELEGGLVSGRTLSQRVAGFSPLLGEEVLARAGSKPSREQLAETLRTLCRDIAANRFSPALYLDGPDGAPLAAHAIRLTHLPCRQARPTTYQAVAEFIQAADEADRLKQRRQALTRRIQAHQKRTERKRQVHEEDIVVGSQALEDRHMGELILAWIHTIPKGSEGVLLDDYHQPGKQLYCPLNPKLSAADNANLYFNRAKRKQRKLESATRLLGNDLDELIWLESLLAATGYAESEEDLAAVEHEYLSREARTRPLPSKAPSRDSLPGRPASKKRRQQSAARPAAKGKQKTVGSEPPLAPRRFRSSDGFLISSGRNNLQNDRILRKAGRDDLWFHAKNLPGSHIILSTNGREPSHEAIREAAVIAAWYSGAGRAGSPVEIDYCPVRQVKKIPASRPGHVTYRGHQTLYVKPEDPSGMRVETKD